MATGSDSVRAARLVELGAPLQVQDVELPAVEPRDRARLQMRIRQVWGI